MDQTFDVGWDKSTAVSPEDGSNARATGRVYRVDFALKPDFHPDHADPARNAGAWVQHPMLRQ
ncbi:hypothetical protein KRR26_07580 [Corallococcus sp. M34]|uniref:hypothetical protein n=1 Tax=Citreicoccus inhibens TaxID=2849499 RepID=UPI001C21E850|nr:hypothetical protein [Citreicoccus inhibens]MBU8895460.1 hypothetical protein [Citreicoccus inhibens]